MKLMNLLPSRFYQLLLILCGGFALSYPSVSIAQSPEPFQPYFASLRNDRVNLRSGPGMQYGVEWVYQRKSLPVEVINKYRDWLQIRDMEKTTGWIRQDQVVASRTGLTTTTTIMYSQNQADSPPVARLENGVIVMIDRCLAGWCQVRVKDYKGWVNRQHMWGLYPEEMINPR